MTSRVTVHRKTGTKTRNPDGTVGTGWEPVHTDLPFRLGGSEQGGAGFRTVTIGESEVRIAVRVGHFPASTSDLTDLDYVEITSGENAGAVLCVAEATWQDQATARRVPVFEVQRPEEWP